MVAACIMIILGLLTAYLWQTGFFLEVFHKRALLTPVLLMDLDLGDDGRASQNFSLAYPGRYSVNLELKPRTVPGEGVAGVNFPELDLQGNVQIHDEKDSTLLHREFRVQLKHESILPKLLEFESSDVGIEETRSFAIAVRTTPELRQSYERIRVYVVRELRYAVLD
jgi:hypothetical protein